MTNVDLLKQAITSGKAEYERVLKKTLKNNLTNKEFDEFDDYLISVIKKRPVLVKEISLINLKVFKKLKIPYWIGYTYNTLIISLVYSNSVELILPYVTESLIFCMDNGNIYSVGHSICGNLNRGLNIFKQDEVIQVKKLTVDFYRKYKKNRLVVKYMLEASLIFSNFGAYQPAYRVIAEAEEFCIENNMRQSHANVVATLGAIAMEEADFPFAEKAYQSAFDYYRNNNKKIPFLHVFNWGTLLIRTGKYAEAENVFTKIKSEYSRSKDPRVDLNLAIAYKNQQKFAEAINILRELEEKIDPADDSEWLMEFYIILSSALALNSDYRGAALYLNKSVFVIEKYLHNVFRFHYRRGVRGKYYRRIVSILEILLPEVASLELLNVFVYLKTNSQSDWLSIITWVENVKTNAVVDFDDIKELDRTFNNLVSFGGAVVNSFKEKYDDPFEAQSIDTKEYQLPGGHHLPWQELAITIQKIVFKYSINSPYELNRIAKLSAAIIEKLNNDGVVLFVFIVAGKYLICRISEDKNSISEIDSAAIIEHAVKLNAYRNPGKPAVDGSSTPKSAFRESLQSITIRLSYALNDLINLIVSEKKKSITIVPDVFDTSLPLFATFFSEEELLEMFYSGSLSIEIVPVLFKGDDGKKAIDSATVITNKFNSLDLFEEEGKLVENYFKPKCSNIVVGKGTDLEGWSVRLRSSGCIHVISHGRPISFYTDPSFSALDGESLSLQSFQGIFLSSECLLFILNACNSADTVNSNYHNFFKSYEAVSNVSILLQNRKAKVIAAQWPELDTFSFVFTSIFYDKLKRNGDIKIAFAQSIAEIRRADKSYFIDIVSKIENKTIREQKVQMIEIATSDHPFDRVLMFGCLNLYGLL